MDGLTAAVPAVVPTDTGSDWKYSEFPLLISNEAPS